MNTRKTYVVLKIELIVSFRMGKISAFNFISALAGLAYIIWNSRPDNKCNVFKNSYFLTRGATEPLPPTKQNWHQSSTRGTYLTSMGTFRHVYGELGCLQQVVGQKKCSLRITFVER